MKKVVSPSLFFFTKGVKRMNALAYVKNALKPVAIKTGKIATKLEVKSPKLLIIGGLGVMTAGLVYACAKSPKAKEQVEEIKTNFNQAEGKKAQAAVIGKGAIDIGKTYAGPVVVYSAGMIMVLAGYRKIDKRLAAVSGLLVAAENRFKEFYNRVSDQFGEEQASQLKDGTLTEVKEITKTNSDGSTSTYKDFVQVLPEGATGFGPYSFIWEERNLLPGVWTKDPWINKNTLINGQFACQRLLEERGYLFLNEALKLMGFAHGVKNGQLVGWIYHKDSKIIGDHAVDIGVYVTKNNTQRHMNYVPHREFLEGREPNVLLDFNCDGYILDEVERLGLFD